MHLAATRVTLYKSPCKLLTSLETLLIYGSQISQADAQELRRALPKLSFDEMT